MEMNKGFVRATGVVDGIMFTYFCRPGPAEAMFRRQVEIDPPGGVETVLEATAAGDSADRSQVDRDKILTIFRTTTLPNR